VETKTFVELQGNGAGFVCGLLVFTAGFAPARQEASNDGPFVPVLLLRLDDVTVLQLGERLLLHGGVQLVAPTQAADVRFCRYRFPATDLNFKATWFGIQ
jgi:hypothetical protein